MTFLVIPGTRHWLNMSNLFSKNIKVKGHQCPIYLLKNYCVWHENEQLAIFVVSRPLCFLEKKHGPLLFLDHTNGDIFISTLTNQPFYYSCLVLSIKLYIEYMVGLYVNILCWIDVLFILENPLGFFYGAAL